MPNYRVNAASISWIDRRRMQMFRALPIGKLTTPEFWLDQLSYGMSHTANNDPPSHFDIRSYRSGDTLARDYRSITTVSIDIEVDAQGKLQRFRKAPDAGGVLDPGYTPPFDSGWELVKGLLGVSLTTIDPTATSKMYTEATTYSQGEKSSLSRVSVPANWQCAGVALPPCSTIQVSPQETILSHTLIKFRAGEPGDYIGVVVMGAPNHVPWVWCESVVTFSPPNKVVIYGAGSAFPSHAFYCQGQQRAKLDLAVDRGTLRATFTRGLKAQITTMVVGMGTATPRISLASVNRQSPLQEAPDDGRSVPEQAFTAPANPERIRVSVML